jgi:hypothetical protein
MRMLTELTGWSTPTDKNGAFPTAFWPGSLGNAATSASDPFVSGDASPGPLMGSCMDAWTRNQEMPKRRV